VVLAMMFMQDHVLKITLDVIFLHAEATASADGYGDTEVRSLAFSEIRKCCLLSIGFIMM
jgi:hypothetical protein